MYNPMIHPCSIYCILPPRMLENIVLNADDSKLLGVTGRNVNMMRLLKAAMLTSSVSHSLHIARIANSEGARQVYERQRLRRLGQRRRATVGEEQRNIFTANNMQKLPGELVRSEGQAATGDAAVDEAYDGLGDTYDLYLKEFDRNSIDDKGLVLNATVHFGKDYDNAQWDGHRMIFGDGDGTLFNRFTIAVDVTGHELTHGVTQYEANLIYWAQSGALNESISDVFGSLVKQRKKNQKADEADWLIGEGLLAEGVQGVALRSMKAPGTAYDDPVLGKDDQPGDMSGYVSTFQDNGGVHTNSGIPNHAFYLAATSIGGYAWEAPGRIWYETLCSPMLKSKAQFKDFARLTVRIAGRLYGANSTEQSAVRDAWNQVGVRV
ncbi:MAG TPA: M4 family metallopeptidase [Pyrinomonadaceae bacterium]|jgi:Zn-dependent metalloprotease|nr:M4 family metallopeptidase [Pyrinomonadaceae bacterium]